MAFIGKLIVRITWTIVHIVLLDEDLASSLLEELHLGLTKIKRVFLVLLIFISLIFLFSVLHLLIEILISFAILLLSILSLNGKFGL